MKKLEVTSTRIVLIWDLVSIVIFLITLFTNKTMNTIISWLSINYALVMIIIGIIATIYVLLVDRIKHVVKSTIEDSVKKVDANYKNYSDAFSSFFIYDSIINKVVRDQIISKMPEKELAHLFYNEGFIVKDLQRFGFSENVVNLVLKEYHENEIKKLKDESDRDQQQVSK